uniref:Uncharacterized protein n=1 Tax=Sphaerodactylus townsendi TaxID=933632 RepID=A0ACB8EJA0_9SAUR
MSSCENEMTRWNLRHIRRITEFLEPATSSSYATKLSSEAPISSIDQCLHIPGKADSAYSSFSGGSNIPECHIPLCYSDHDNLQLEQLAYMDSEYVRGVFNPCAAYSNLKQIYQDKPVAMNMYNNMDNSSPCESTVVPGTLYKPPSPVATLPFCLPHPSFQPAQADSCKTNRNTDQSNSGICLDSTIQAEESSDDSSKTLPFDSSTKCKDDCWLSRCKNQSPGLELENSDIWYLTNQRTTRKNETTIPTKHYLNFQDYMESGSLVHTQKVHNSVYNYKIPEALNSKFSPLPHTICSAVNDTQENKQSLYACSVHKPTFTEADQPCTMSVSSEPEGQFCGDEHSGLDQEICENYPSLKVTDRILPSATAWGIINTYEDKSHCFSSREENSRSAGQPLLKQQDRRQKSPSQGVDIAEIHHSEVYGTTKTISYCKHYEESASQMLNGVKKAKQNENDSPDSLTKPTQEEMLASVHLPQQFSKVESQCQDDSANRKINRKTTPLLYYLSGGKNTNILSNPNQLQEDSAMKSPRSDHSVSAEPTEIPRDCNNCVNDIVASQKTELILGSPASSVDEKFQNDYREKLKIAQRKVLRETSFKRKDLQMSLPIRLKQKPSSRPSIHHLRSLSLSSTNENCKLIPPHKPLENISKEEDLPKPQASRIGGRKRITREQKKISYSEPEKLNQLDDQRDHSTLWRKKNARSRSDEINDQDNVIVNNKAFENQSRGLSKAELKQIQHNALLQYMERKIGQWPAAAHSSALQKPPLQMRPSNSKKFSEDSISNLSSSKKSQNVDHSCQFPDLGRNPETPPLIFSTTSITPASDSAIASSSVPKKSHWKMQSIASEGSCVNRCASTKSLFHSGASASGKGHGRSKSTPSPMQGLDCKRKQNVVIIPVVIPCLNQWLQ